MKGNYKNLSEGNITMEAMDLWHQRMTHVNTKVMRYMVSKKCYGVNVITTCRNQTAQCVCIRSKRKLLLRRT